MTWFTVSLLSAAFFTVYNLLSRMLSIDSENPRAFSAVYNFIAGFLALGLLLIDHSTFKPMPIGIIGLTLLMIVLYGIFHCVEFYAKKYVEISTLTIITRIYPVITFVASTIFLAEQLTWTKIIAVGLIMLGNGIVLYKSKLKLGRGIHYAFILAVSLGLAWTVDKVTSAYYPLPIYAFLGYTASNFFVIYFPTLPLSDMKRELKRTTWKIVLLALCNILAFYSVLKAFSLGEASRVSLVASSYSILTVLLGIILLKERTNIVRKILAGIVVFAGVVLLR
jgi:uncharacterized membrane protein